MNIPYLCIFLAFLLNYLTKIPVGFAMAKMQGGYNNCYPRDQQAQLTGWGKRALSAHLNGFEIFPAFAVSVIIAHLAGVNEQYLTLLSITFIASRILYIGLYLADRDRMRSTIWSIGPLCVIANFVLAIFFVN
jgi:uncharacterized MAPEG superfamily protein